MAAVAHKATHRLLDACGVISLFPLSLLFVWILENLVGLD